MIVDTQRVVRSARQRPMLGILALIAFFLLAGFVAYEAYLGGSHTVTALPQPSQDEALASRAVIFIIDGFHSERAFDPAVMPVFTELAMESVAGIAKTNPITMTGPSIYSLMTGRFANLLQAVMNFSSPDPDSPSGSLSLNAQVPPAVQGCPLNCPPIIDAASFHL